MLGDIVECYVDDLVVKSHQRSDHLKHLGFVLDKLVILTKQEPTKMWSIASGKFFAFIVLHKGLKSALLLRRLSSSHSRETSKNLRITRLACIYLQVHHNFFWTCQPFSRVVEKRYGIWMGPTMWTRTESIKKIPHCIASCGQPMKGKPLVLYITTMYHSIGSLLA